jgi:hypothetical protein
MQGIKGCTVTEANRDAIWQEVVRQVSDQGCGLGYRAAAPPLVSSQAAEAAARDAPAPLSADALDGGVSDTFAARENASVGLREIPV